MIFLDGDYFGGAEKCHEIALKKPILAYFLNQFDREDTTSFMKGESTTS